MRGEGQRQALELHSCAADSQGSLAHQMVCKCVCVWGGSHLLKMFLGELGFKGVCTAVSQGGKTYLFSSGSGRGPKPHVHSPRNSTACSSL